MKKNILATVLTIISLIIAIVLVFVIVGKIKNKKPTTDTTITQEIVTDYNIVYVLDEGVNNPNNLSKYNKNTTYTLLDASKDGYEFIGWYLDSSYTTKVTEINSSLNGDITLYAKFEEIIDYNITYYLYDGENNADNPTTFNRLSNYTLKPATKDGYEFVGWFLEAGFTTQVTKLDSSLSSDIELHAKFVEIVNYNITYNLDGGTNDPDNITTFNKFTDFTLKNASKNKYEFKGWFLETGFINQVTKIDSSFTEDIELFAKFEKIVYDYDYTITYHLDGGENNPNNPDGFFEDETIELYSAKKTGYDFKGWYTSEAHTLEITSIEANMDYELYAWFDLHEYSITYHNVDGLTNENPSIYTITDGTFNLKNVDKPRYNFLGWYTTSTFDEESKITSIDSSTLKDYDLYAQFEVAPVEPTYSVIPNELTYNTLDQELLTYTVENGTIYFSLDNENYSNDIPTGKDAGEYKVYYKIIGINEEYLDILDQTITITISKKLIDNSNIELVDETFTYDGTVKSLTYSGTLPEGITGVYYHDNEQINVGEYNPSMTFEYDTNNYTVSVLQIYGYLTIEKATIDMTSVVFDGLTVTYDGNVHTISVDNLPDEITGVVYKDIDGNEIDNFATNAGTYVIYAHFTYDTENYNEVAPKPATLTIEKAEITGAAVTGYKGDFDDESHNAAATYTATTVDGSAITWLFSNDNATWVAVDELTVKNPSDSKTYYYKASAANHEDLTGTFTVKIRTIATITITNLAALSKTYDGYYIVDPIIDTNSTQTPYIVYMWGPNSSAQKPTNANTYTIKVSVSENEDYTACVITETFVIEKANYTLPANLFADKTVTYTGEEFELTLDESLLPSTLSVTYSTNKLTNVGSILVTATFNNSSDNYNDVDPMTATLTINPATITNPDVVGYTGVADDDYHNAAVTYTATTVDGSTITWLFSDDNETWITVDQLKVKEHSDTGTYYYKASAANHNDLTGTFNVVISDKTPATITITNLDELSKTYDGSAIVDPVINTDSNGEVTITYSLDGETFTDVKPINAGTYTIKVETAETSTYAQGIITKTFTISKDTIDTTGIEFEGLTVTYDGNVHTISVDNLPTEITGVVYKDVDGNVIDNFATNAGTYVIYAHFTYDTANYNEVAPKPATLTIEKAEITGASVTGYKGDFDDESHNAAVEYSATTVDGSTITWLFSNDNATWVTVNELTVKNPSDSKTYYFKASAANHEDLTGTFTVKIRTIATITITNLAALSKTYDGFAIVDPIIDTNSTQTPYIVYMWGPNSSAQKPANANTYTIKVSVSENEDYTACVITETFVISPATITNPNVVGYSGIIDGEYHNAVVTYTATTVNNATITWLFSNDGENWVAVNDLKVKETTDSGTYYYKATASNHEDLIGSFEVEVLSKYITTITITNINDLSKVYDGFAIVDPEINTNSNGTPYITYTWGPNTSAQKPTNANTYTIKVRIAETEQYTECEITETFVIEKANPDYTVPTNLTATLGQTLADVTLPTGFSFEEALTTSVGPAGNNTFHVTFTPTSTQNYNVIENIEVTVKVLVQYVIICENNQETTYNATAQGPVVTVKLNGEVVTTGFELAYTNKKSTASSYSDGLPTDAGTYSIKINCSGDDGLDASEVIVTYTINKCKVKFVVSNMEADYNANIRTWEDHKEYMESRLAFSDLDNNIMPISGNILGINNGYFYYGQAVDGLKTIDTVAGSVYKVTVGFESGNYEIVGNDYFMYTYRTAYVNSKYYTIEEALQLTSGNITLAGSIVSTTSYVVTSTCNLDDDLYPYSTRNFSYSRTLYIPYTHQGTTAKTQYESVNADTTYTCSALIITPNTSITFSGTVNVCAKLAGYGRACNHGVLYNDGNITFESGSTFNTYGFTKGLGQITLKSGSTMLDIMEFDDYGSASGLLKVYDSGNGAWPITIWTIHNATCPIRINKGATYSVWTAAYGTSAGYNPASATIIAPNNSTTNCLFKPSANATDNSYILKRTIQTDATKSINGLNQGNGVRNIMDVIEMHGNYEDSSFSISVGTTLKTSTTTPIVIPSLSVEIVDNSVLTISKISFVFGINTYIKIGKGSELKVNNGYVVVDKLNGSASTVFTYNSYITTNKKDGKFTVDGTISGTGSIGGIVETTTEDAVLSVSKYSVSGIKMKSSGSGYSSNGSISATGSIYNGSTYADNQPFTNGNVYASIQNGSKYYFEVNNNVNTFTINYYVDGTLVKSQPITVVNEDSYTITGNEYSAAKQYYEFVEWLDSGNHPLGYNGNNILTTSNPSINLYASFTLKNYHFSYLVKYNGEDITDDVTFTNLIDTFTIDSFVDNKITITTTASYNSMFFDGWYLGIDKSTNIKLTQITRSQFERFVNEIGMDTIPFYGEFSSVEYYTIGIADTTNGTITAAYSIPQGTSLNSNNININYDPNSYNNNSSFASYITGFKFGTTTYTYEEMLNYNITGDTAFIVQWGNKKSITLKNYAGETESTIYCMLGGSIILPSGNSYYDLKSSGATTTNGYYYNKLFDHWNVTLVDGLYVCTGDSSISAVYTEEKYCLVTFSVDAATISISGGDIIEGAGSKGDGSTAKVVYGGSITVTFTYNNSDTQSCKMQYNNNTTINLTTGQTYAIPTNATITIYSEQDSSCLLATSEVMLADGTIKLAKDITTEDTVISFNNFTGQFEATKISFYAIVDYSWFDIIELTFDNGKVLKVATGHGLFNMTYNKYEIYYAGEFENHIGETFATVDYIDGEFVISGATLVSVRNTKEYVQKYSPISEYNINIVADGVLTIPDDIEGMYDIFTFNDDLTIDIVCFISEVEMYGTFSYDEVKDIVPEYLFDVVNFKYFKTFILKGVLTIEQVNHWLDAYLPIIVEEHNLEFDYENRQFLTSDMFN